MQTTDLGLRERKQIETRQRLEKAAVTLVLRDGLDKTTIDAISAAADVSTRTFFNYFDSKEDAVLGIRDMELSEGDVAAHLEKYAELGLVASVIHLLFDVLGPTVNDAEMRKSRMTILHATPSLLSRQMIQMTRMGELLIAAVTTITTQTTGTTPSRPIAELTLAMCGSATRVAVHEWAEQGSEKAVEKIRERAQELVREAMALLK